MVLFYEDIGSLVVAVLLVLIFLGVFWYGNYFREVRLQRSLINSGVATCGIVLSRNVVGYDEGGDVCNYVVAFDSGTDDLRLVTGVSNDEFAVGDTLTVLYSPQDPTRSTIYKFSDFRGAKPKGKINSTRFKEG